MSGLPCFYSFADSLADDFGVDEQNKETVKLKVQKTEAHYDSIKPAKTLSQVVSDGKSCVTISAEVSYEKFDRLFNDFIISCLVIVFVVSVMLVFLIGSKSYSLAVLFAAFGLASLFFVIYLFYTRVTSVGSESSEESLQPCLENFQKEISDVSSAEKDAVLNSMCFYVSL